MIRYVWLDVQTGEFSGSWTEDWMKSMNVTEQSLIDISKDHPTHKLIKYECVNHPEFELYHWMKLR